MHTELPWFQFHWTKWMLSRKVKAMSFEHRGLYFHLLLESWADGPLPDDPATLAAICGIPLADFERLWPLIRPAFTVTADGRLASAFLEEMREHHTARYEQARAAGAKGGRPPKSKQKPDAKPDGYPDAKPIDRVDRQKESTAEAATGRINAPSPSLRQLDGRPLALLPDRADPMTPDQEREWAETKAAIRGVKG
jgi:uncharacterized protein YdaU (DUF1376 family)